MLPEQRRSRDLIQSVGLRDHHYTSLPQRLRKGTLSEGQPVGQSTIAHRRTQHQANALNPTDWRQHSFAMMGSHVPARLRDRAPFKRMVGLYRRHTAQGDRLLPRRRRRDEDVSVDVLFEGSSFRCFTLPTNEGPQGAPKPPRPTGIFFWYERPNCALVERRTHAPRQFILTYIVY